MILKGSQRGGSRQLAAHLLKTEENEHVEIHEIRGFVSDDLKGALHEAYAMSRGTRCSQFLFSLSLTPPETENVPVSAFEHALEKIEKKLGLENQPRVVIFHEKENRRHAHCVWSRIDTENLKAVHLSYFKNKLNEVGKQLYLQYGWKLPEGFIDKENRNPLNYTLAEWQHAKRIGLDAKEIKSTLQECWAVSDDKKSFEQALSEKGFYLAQGDKRGFVAVNWQGEVFSLSRSLAVKPKDIKKRLGEPEELPSVPDIKENISYDMRSLYKSYTTELSDKHKQAIAPLLQQKQQIVKRQRIQRAALASHQEERKAKENSERLNRFRTGFLGVWDWMNGRYWRTRKQNEQELKQCNKRDNQEKDRLVQKHLNERRKLQEQFKTVKNQHQHETEKLKDSFAQYLLQQNKLKSTQTQNTKPKSHNHRKGGPEPEM